jgi:hypothetical protein
VLNSLPSAQTDARTADQRRADALVDVFARVLGDPGLPERHGQRPAINVTVPISTLLGCDEQPAHLDGYGPITAALACRLAADPQPGCATSTTPSPGATAVRRTARTSRPSASATTTPNTTPAGKSNTDKTGAIR